MTTLAALVAAAMIFGACAGGAPATPAPTGTTPAAGTATPAVAPATPAVATATPAAQELETVTVGLAAFQDVSSIYVGIEQGFYEEAGLELDIQQTDWPGAQELLIGGHVDIAVTSDADVVAANAEGQEVTLTFPLFFFAGAAMMYDEQRFPEWMTFDEMLAETGGDDREALKRTLEQTLGHSIGMQVPGGQYASLLTMAKDVGIPFEEFTVVNLVQEDLPPALFSNSIDIMMGGIPQRLAAVDEGYATLMDATAWPPSIDHAGFGTLRSWADENPETRKRFQEVIFRTQQYILDNPDESFDIISRRMREMGSTVSADELHGVWNVMEFFVSTKEEYGRDVASPDGRFYWRDRFEEVVGNYIEQEQISDFDVPLEDIYYGLSTVEMTEAQ